MSYLLFFFFLSVGYQGRFCEIPIDPCQNNPCENSGTCIRTKYNNNFRCVCPTNYSGRTCNIYIKNFCSSSPCFSNATCENLPDGYRCICSSNESCDKTKLILETKICSLTNPCIYGTCQQGKCSCLPGWTGEFCSEDINECQTNPCSNQGTCYVRLFYLEEIFQNLNFCNFRILRDHIYVYVHQKQQIKIVKIFNVLNHLV